MWDNRQHHCRWIFRIVINTLQRYRHLSRNSQRSTSIQIPIILGEGARTNLQSDTMPGFEELTGVPAINVDEIRTSAILGVSLVAISWRLRR